MRTNIRDIFRDHGLQEPDRESPLGVGFSGEKDRPYDLPLAGRIENQGKQLQMSVDVNGWGESALPIGVSRSKKQNTGERKKRMRRAQ